MVVPLISPIDMPLNHIQPSCRVEFPMILLLLVLYPIYITNLASYIIIIPIKSLLLVSYKPCISPLRTHEMSLYPTKSHRNPMNIPFYHHFGWSEHYGYIPFISKFGYIPFISNFYYYILVIFHFGWLRSPSPSPLRREVAPPSSTSSREVLRAKLCARLVTSAKNGGF